MTDRYTLTFGAGLCNHGCGEPVANPRNKFINGHDAKLMDVLLDAHKDDIRITLSSPDSHRQMRISAMSYAKMAFWPRGYRWFLIKANITEPAYDELAGAEDPDLSHLDLGSAKNPGLTLTDEEILRLAQQKMAAVAEVFRKARFDGDRRDVVDVETLFNPASGSRVHVEAARVLLGMPT